MIEEKRMEMIYMKINGFRKFLSMVKLNFEGFKKEERNEEKIFEYVKL